MLVRDITEEEIYGIGHAFGYYDYGAETGMTTASSRFAELFKKSTGILPIEYRKIAWKDG